MSTFLQQVENFFGLTNQTAVATPSTASSGSSNVNFTLSLNNGSLASGETLFIAGNGNATVTASGSDPHIIIGGNGTDTLTGGDGPDLIVGGTGTNVMTGGGGTDVFGHAAGATDFITDFAPNEGERIALQNGLSMTSSQTVSVDPSTIGQPSGSPEPSTQMTFSDGSTITLVNSQLHPDSSWFI